VASDYNDRWRNFGLLWVYVFANVALAMFVYWAVRMPKNKMSKKKAKKA
jgi:ATP-binding cassette subfamily G (WHITE) protein 2 (PDR)